MKRGIEPVKTKVGICTKYLLLSRLAELISYSQSRFVPPVYQKKKTCGNAGTGGQTLKEKYSKMGRRGAESDFEHIFLEEISRSSDPDPPRLKNMRPRS